MTTGQNAPLDENSRQGLYGLSSANDNTRVDVWVNPITHAVLVDDGGGGSGTVTSITAGTGLTATPTNPITTSGTILLDSKLAPLDTLGSANQLIRVNAAATALEYFTASAGGVASVVGTANRITVDSTDPANPIVDIAATYVGQASITTLGTISTGTWAGTTIALNHGGTGQTTKAAAFDALSPMSAGGDLIYGGTSGTGTRLANGSAGQVLTSAGTTLAPTWSSITTAGLTVGTSTITSGTTTRILYDNAGVLGEYMITGSGTVVAMQTAPTFVTNITTPVINLSGTSNQAVFQSAGVTGTLTWTPTSTNKTITFPDATGTVALTTGGAFALVVGTTTVTSGTSTRILYDNAGVLGEYTLTGSGTVVMMQTAPTFVTSLTGPLIIGGSGTTGTQLSLQTTSGNGTTDALVIKGGNNGATTFATFSAALLALAAGSITMTGSLAATGARVTKGWFTDIESTDVPTVGGVALPTATSTTTFTNKRITPRVLSAAAYTTDTGSSINGDTQDMFIVTAQTGALKFNNPSGTPTDGQKFIISVASSTTSARALTWDTSYGSTTVVLPTTTAATTATLTIGFIWSASKSLWQCVAVA